MRFRAIIAASLVLAASSAFADEPAENWVTDLAPENESRSNVSI